MGMYRIKDVQCGTTAMGLDADTVVVEVELETEDGTSIFLSNTEFEGFPNIYRTEESTFARQLYCGSESEEEMLKLSIEDRNDMADEFVGELNATSLFYSGDNYNDFYDDPEFGGELREALRYLIYMTQASWRQYKAFRKKTIGKVLGEFKIPKSEAEKDREEV